MRKIVALFVVICFLCFSGCGENIQKDKSNLFDMFEEAENEKLAAMRNELSDNLFGVAYLGEHGGTYSEIKNYIKNHSFYSEIDFVDEIAESHFFENKGTEIFLVIPGENTEIVIEALNFNEEYELVPEKVIGRINDGKPIIIRGSLGEYIPGINIKAELGGETVEFAPSLSGYDGRIVSPEGKVKVWHLFN